MFNFEVGVFNAAILKFKERYMFFKRSFKKNGLDKLIVGLGNYGIVYENTRHNAGFDAIDYLAEKFEVSFKVVKKFDGLFGKGEVAGVNCGFLKPLTYMNNSGIAVSKVCNFYKLNLEDIVVLVDDISFDPGKIRIKRKGSAGTHNGLKSIISELDGEDFVRVKIGVGAKPNLNFDLAKWVISKFNDEDYTKMKLAYRDVADAVVLIVTGRIDSAMNKHN